MELYSWPIPHIYGSSGLAIASSDPPCNFYILVVNLLAPVFLESAHQGCMEGVIRLLVHSWVRSIFSLYALKKK